MSEVFAGWDVEDPLKPIEGESITANKALNDYARMGYARSLRSLLKRYQEMDVPPTSSFGTMAHWSQTFSWVDRVALWDEIERRRQERVWRDRRDSLRQKEWDNFEKLQDIVSDLLDTIPSFITSKEKIVQKGSPKVIAQDGTVIEPGVTEKKVVTLKFDANTANKFIRTASEIGRKAAEMNQDGVARILKELDFDKLEPEQISRLAAGEHLLDVLGVRK